MCDVDDLYPKLMRCQTSILRKPCAKHLSAYVLKSFALNFQRKHHINLTHISNQERSAD